MSNKPFKVKHGLSSEDGTITHKNIEIVDSSSKIDYAILKNTPATITSAQASAIITNSSHSASSHVTELNDLTDGYSDIVHNYAIGTDSLQNIVPGLGISEAHSNVVFGWRALEDGINVKSNVAIGNDALQNITAGDSNTAIGESAMANATAGGEGNVAVGYHAYWHGGQDRSVAIGRETGIGGDDAVSIGYKANANGDKTIAIGYRANVVTAGGINISTDHAGAYSAGNKINLVNSSSISLDNATISATSTGLFINGNSTSYTGTGVISVSGSNVISSSANNYVHPTGAGKEHLPSSVSQTEAGYLNGVTSAIQTQLNAKADTDTTYTAGTGITLSGTVFSASPLALTSVQTAATQTLHLALTAQEGDIVVRTDENKTYCHNGGTAGTMDDYTLLATPTDAVLSVNGATGAVTLTHDGFSDFVANEHIDWTADQGAVNLHSGNYTDTTYSVGDGGLTQKNFTTTLKTKLDNITDNANNYVHPASHTISEITNLQTELDAKTAEAVAMAIALG